MDISIIIVTWNARAYAREALESLEQDESLLRKEIIVVDNASVDGTPEMVEADFPHVRLVRNASNLGFAKGNNAGIEIATGKYLLLINSDVHVPPDCIGKLFDFMEINPGVGVAGPRMLSADGRTLRSCMRFPTVWNSFCRAMALDSSFPHSRLFGGLLMRDFSHDHVMDVEVLNGWFWIVRKRALDEVGPLDERFFMYAEDVDWCYRFHQYGWRAVYFPDAAAVHYGGGSSARTPERFYVAKLHANLQYWWKHRRALSTALYIASLLLSESFRVLGYGFAYLLRDSRKGSIYKMKRSGAALRFLILGGASQGREVS